MVKHLAKEFFYQLPSGNEVHPSRLIHRDGTIMWKHALACGNEFVAASQCMLPHDCAISMYETARVHFIPRRKLVEELLR